MGRRVKVRSGPARAARYVADVPPTLTDAGLAVQTLAEILADVRAELQDPVDGFGPLHDVTSATSPLAILAAFQARREAQYSSLLASVTSALAPGGASGTMLDRQLRITGAAARIGESHSTVLVRLAGTPGTNVSNKLVRYAPTQTLWRTPGDIVIDGDGQWSGSVRAEEPGPLDAAVSDEWEIVSTTNGWDYLTSIDDAQVGEVEEDDPTVRDRLAKTDSVGRGTEPAIHSRLLELPGVTSIAVDNNRELFPNVNGVPGKTVESLVIGGEDEAIAEVLHETYEADSGSFGNTTVVFTNRFGKEITILFSRVDEVQTFAEVTLDTTGAETDLPTDYEARVRGAVGARAVALAPGQDLHSAWFVGAVVAALPVNSVVDVTVEFALTEAGPFNSVLSLTSRQQALLADAPVPARAKSLQRPEGFDVTMGWHLDLSIDGGPTVVITFPATATLTGQQVAGIVQSALLAADAGALASGSLNRLLVTTKDAGAATSIAVVNTSTAGLLAELGNDFAVATTYTGADAAIGNIVVI